MRVLCLRIKSRGIDESGYGSTNQAANDGRVQDKVFCSAPAVIQGVCVENHSPTEPFVILPFFGPEANTEAPEIGAASRSVKILIRTGAG